MIYDDLPRYLILLTFINVVFGDWLQIDTEHPQNGVGKLGLMQALCISRP